MKLIFLGPPGSGKGTIATLMVKELNFTHISTGEILRQNVQRQTPLGLVAKPLIENGLYVPDEIMMKLIKNEILKLEDNYILDGYPRTIKQAKDLLTDVKIDKVIFLDVSLEIILDRLKNRRQCSNPNCKAIFNLKNYKEDYCNICKHKLIQREDDKAEIITKRYEIYKKETSPLIDFYKDILIRIDASESQEKVFQKTKSVLLGRSNATNK